MNFFSIYLIIWNCVESAIDVIMDPIAPNCTKSEKVTLK